MLRRPAQRNEYDPEQYLRDADNRFSFDPESGIYRPKTDYKEAERKKLKILSLSLFEWGTLILSAATLFFLIKYTNYARLQWKETQKTAIEAGRSANAAETAADTAGDSLKTAKESFVIDQRPYVVVDEGNPQFVDIPPSPKKPVMVNIYLKNIGKSSAVQVLTQSHLFPVREKLITEVTPGERKQEVRKWISLMESKFAKMQSDDQAARIEVKALAVYSPGRDLPPSQRILLTPSESIEMKEADIASLISQRLVFVVIGYASYSDSQGTPYVTEYCYQFVGPYPTIWHICDSHNRIR